MFALFSFFMVIVISMIVTRVASIALTHTGLSSSVASFQARSGFSGAGFTTTESERIVNHPVRRRIIMALMLLGNAGIVTAITSLILTFVGQSEPGDLTFRVAGLVVGVLSLWYLASSKWVNRKLSRVVEKALQRHTHLDVKDYESVLQLTGDYRIVELQVTPGDWLVDKSLAEAELNREGILVLAVQRRNGDFVGAPRGATKLSREDTVYVYGNIEQIRALDERKRGWLGDVEHRRMAAAKAAAKDEESGD